jgi:outer membrane lipoprotein-sorting protein
MPKGLPLYVRVVPAGAKTWRCAARFQILKFLLKLITFCKNPNQMKANKSLSLFLIFQLALITSIFAQDAIEIVKKADEKMRGKTSQAEMTIKTTRPTWTREMTVKTWIKGNDYAMILIQAPARDKGTVFLKRKKEVWNWLPTVERSIKLPPSMMSQSWMGTDFTNDDLVKESSIVEDYTHTQS